MVFTTDVFRFETEFYPKISSEGHNFEKSYFSGSSCVCNSDLIEAKWGTQRTLAGSGGMPPPKKTFTYRNLA